MSRSALRLQNEVFLHGYTFLIAAKVSQIDGLSILVGSAVEFGPIDLGVVSPDTAKRTSESGIATASSLDSQSLTHDGAAATENLKVGHAAAAGRGIVGSGGREAAKGSG